MKIIITRIIEFSILINVVATAVVHFDDRAVPQLLWSTHSEAIFLRLLSFFYGLLLIIVPSTFQQSDKKFSSGTSKRIPRSFEGYQQVKYTGDIITPSNLDKYYLFIRTHVQKGKIRIWRNESHILEFCMVTHHDLSMSKQIHCSPNPSVWKLKNKLSGITYKWEWLI